MSETIKQLIRKDRRQAEREAKRVPLRFDDTINPDECMAYLLESGLSRKMTYEDRRDWLAFGQIFDTATGRKLAARLEKSK